MYASYFHNSLFTWLFQLIRHPLFLLTLSKVHFYFANLTSFHFLLLLYFPQGKPLWIVFIKKSLYTVTKNAGKYKGSMYLHCSQWVVIRNPNNLHTLRFHSGFNLLLTLLASHDILQY